MYSEGLRKYGYGYVMEWYDQVKFCYKWGFLLTMCDFGKKKEVVKKVKCF